MYIQTPNSPASDFILEEEGGVTLTLTGRFLPYRPIRIEGKQRAEFTWYPGSPEATVQMLGPEEGSIRLQGFWKDKFLASEGSDVTVEGRPAVGGISLISTSNVAEIVQTVDNMRRMGRRITMKWSGLQRVGHITSFAHTWHNIHDCEWEIEFSVLSQGEGTVPSVSPVAVTLPDIYAQAVKEALAIQQRIIEASGLPNYVKLTGAMNISVAAFELTALAYVNALGDVARGYADATFSVSQGARRALSTLTSAVVGFGIQADATADMALSEFVSTVPFGGQDNMPMGAQLAANSVQRTYADTIRKARYSFALTRRLMAAQSAGEAAQVQTYTPPTDAGLRDISNRFYNTPNYWQDLMVYNGLSNSRVAQGTQLSIPPATAFNDSQTTRDG